MYIFWRSAVLDIVDTPKRVLVLSGDTVWLAGYIL